MNSNKMESPMITIPHNGILAVGITFQDVSFSYPSRPEEPVLKVSCSNQEW